MNLRKTAIFIIDKELENYATGEKSLKDLYVTWLKLIDSKDSVPNARIFEAVTVIDFPYLELILQGRG